MHILIVECEKTLKDVGKVGWIKKIGCDLKHT